MTFLREKKNNEGETAWQKKNKKYKVPRLRLCSDQGSIPFHPYHPHNFCFKHSRLGVGRLG